MSPKNTTYFPLVIFGIWGMKHNACESTAIQKRNLMPMPVVLEAIEPNFLLLQIKILFSGLN